MKDFLLTGITLVKNENSLKGQVSGQCCGGRESGPSLGLCLQACVPDGILGSSEQPPGEEGCRPDAQRNKCLREVECQQQGAGLHRPG